MGVDVNDATLEAVAKAFQRMHRNVCYPECSINEAKWAAQEILAALPPAPHGGAEAAFAAGFHAAERGLGFEGCDESAEALAIEWGEYLSATTALSPPQEQEAAPKGEAALCEALKFYANEANWIDSPPWDGDPDCITSKAIPVTRQDDGSTVCDCGDRARAALAFYTAPPSPKAEPSDRALREALDKIRTLRKPGQFGSKLSDQMETIAIDALLPRIMHAPKAEPEQEAVAAPTEEMWRAYYTAVGKRPLIFSIWKLGWLAAIRARGQRAMQVQP